MHEKQIPIQEWICLKCPRTSQVEGDQFLNSQRAWACWNMVATGIVFEIPRLTVKCTLSLSKWIDNLSRYQWIPNSTQNFVYSGHRWRKAKDFFVFCSRKICMVLFHCSFVSRHLCLVHKINAQTHHNHPRHLFITWIYRECKVQNGLIS